MRQLLKPPAATRWASIAVAFLLLALGARLALRGHSVAPAESPSAHSAAEKATVEPPARESASPTHGTSATATSANAEEQSESSNSVRVQVEHAIFHPTDDVAMQVERLNGRMVGTEGHIISLDDRNSYSVHIDQGVTRLSAEDLSRLVNSYLLRQADSAIRHVDISFDGEQVVIKGKVHKLITLPFEGRATLSATPDGEMRMHMETFRVAGVLSKGFLALFGIHLDTVAEPAREPSFRVVGDDFFAPISNLFPPPLVYGRITRIKVEGQNLLQVIGIEAEHHALETIPKALPEPPNYIYFTGGRMRFGKVTMDNVDLKLVNLIPKESFDFSLEHYQQQIQAGYVKVLPTLGLIVYAKDYSDLNKKQP